MRPMNITGVTNNNLSVVLVSKGVFLFMARHSCMLYQKYCFIKDIVSMTFIASKQALVL